MLASSTLEEFNRSGPDAESRLEMSALPILMLFDLLNYLSILHLVFFPGAAIASRHGHYHAQ